MSSALVPPSTPEDRSSYGFHVKDVPRINIAAVAAIDNVSPSIKAAFVHANGWLNDPKRYDSVPRRSAQGAPRARLSDEWVAALEKHGICTRIPRAEVRGHVRMFAVPEPAKKRFRPIKHTADANECLGKDTLLPLHFPSKADIVGLVNKGSHFIALDFAAYFDQFSYTPEVGRLFCFRHGSQYFRLSSLAMGQRQAVEVAATTTALLLDYERRTHTEAVIDNVIFVGTREDVIRDAAIFVDRVRAVCGKLNEDTSDLEQLVQQSGDWCGVHLDLAAKSVALTDKSLAKVARSWELRKSWTWRGFAAHIGLLFWAWGILELPMPEFFPVLSFLSRVGQNLTKDESLWDAPAYIWDSVWPVLERWTNMLVANTPRIVRPRTEPEWLVCTDASRYGWGYVALNESTGELRHHGAPWSAHMEQTHGDKLGSSVFAEPHGVVNAVFHLFALNKPTRVKLGTDNTATQASFTRGFNSHSPAINDCIRRLRERFPLLDIDYVYVQGKANPADYASRGGDVDRKDVGRLAHSLRQVMGTGSSS